MARWAAVTRSICGSLLVTGCGANASLFELAQTDTFEQDPDGDTDILFVVDDSATMAEEQDRLAAAFPAFADALDAAGAQFRLSVATTTWAGSDGPVTLRGDPEFLGPDDDYRTLFPDRVRVGTYGSDQEKGLSVAVGVLSGEGDVRPETGPTGPAFRRPDAQLLVVFVSDEDDCSDGGALAEMPPTACYTSVDELLPVASLVAGLEGLVREPTQLLVGSIVAPRDPSCGDAVSGRRYVEATALTGGLPADVCDEDWTAALTDLGVAGAGIRTTFPLSRAALVDSIEVEVDGAAVPPDPSDGWTWNPATWYLELHGSAVAAPGAQVTVRYTVDGSVPAPESTDIATY